MILFTLAILFFTPVFGQDTGEWVAPPMADWFLQFDAFYAAAYVAFGYLSTMIPVLNRLKAFWRVLAFAVLTGLGLWYFKDVSILKIALNYFIANVFYTVILRDGMKLKSPEPKES